MTTTADLVALIAPEHAGKSKFAATVALSVDPLVRMEAALQALYLDFDLDAAVGPQLDAVGLRVGRSRLVPVPLEGLFFSWGDPFRGWGAGIWKGAYAAGSSIQSLDDDTYRRLLRAKVLANRWDGAIASLEAIYAAFFPASVTLPIESDAGVEITTEDGGLIGTATGQTLVFVSDDTYSAQPLEFLTWGDPNRGWGRGEWAQPSVAINAPSIASTDMKITVGFAGSIPSVLDLAILDEGLVGAKPEGVTVELAVTSVDGAPIFGWGLQNEYISGWGTGAWPGTPSEILVNDGRGQGLASDDGLLLETDDGSILAPSIATAFGLAFGPAFTNPSLSESA